jgi:ketosteroid isomerase-like protein
MENQTTESQSVYSPEECMRRVATAISHQDLDALTDCFEPDYNSEFPAHPERAFSGHAAMRRNWSEIFGAVPDIETTIRTCTASGETVWVEWEWKGTRADGLPFLQRGVTVQGVPRGRIAWARLYVEPVQTGGPSVADLVGRKSAGRKSR